MASGSFYGWTSETPRQMVEISGEKLLYRTIRQLKERGVKDITVIVPSKNAFGKLPVKQVVGNNGHGLHNILNTKPIVKDKGLIIFGDTCFKDNAMDIIVKSSDDMMFFGSTIGEMFAIRTSKLLYKKAKELHLQLDNPKVSEQWKLYRYVNGQPIDIHKMGEHFTYIDDGTDDIDYPRDYEKMKEW